MLRSLNRRIVVRLFSNSIHLSLYRKWPHHLIATRQISTHDQELPQLLATTAHTLRESDWHGGVQLVIGNRWLRFAALPWDLQTGNPAKDQMTATALCSDILESAERANAPGAHTPWTILLDRPHYGHDRLAAAIHTELTQHLLSFSTKRNPFVLWQPWISVSWDIFRKRLPSTQGTLYVPEPGCLTLLTYSQGRVHAVHQRFFPPTDPGALLSLLRMEQLQHDQALNLVTDGIPEHWQADLKEFGQFPATPQTVPERATKATQESLA